ncbi:MAG: hypothetical protein ACFFBD_15895, partial [Candidatus Hodarchaeota archaeon]
RLGNNKNSESGCKIFRRIFLNKDKHKMEAKDILKIIGASFLIVLILPIIGALTKLVVLNGRNLFPLGVVVVYAITACVIYYVIDNDFPKTIAMTTILLLILYFIRWLLNVTFIL